MKKLVLFALATLIMLNLTSCSVGIVKLNNINRMENSYFLDYKKYIDKGFMFTPVGLANLSDKYEIIGNSYFKIRPEAKYGYKETEAEKKEIQDAVNIEELSEWTKTSPVKMVISPNLKYIRVNGKLYIKRERIQKSIDGKEKEWIVNDMFGDDVLGIVYRECKEFGADGICDFTIKRKLEYYNLILCYKNEGIMFDDARGTLVRDKTAEEILQFNRSSKKLEYRILENPIVVDEWIVTGNAIRKK